MRHIGIFPSITAVLLLTGRTSQTSCAQRRTQGATLQERRFETLFRSVGFVPDVGFLRVNEADSFFKGTRSLDPNRETLNHSAGHEKLLMLTHLISEETPSLRLPTRNSMEPNI